MKLLLAASLTTIFAGCAASVKPAVELPPTSAVIPKPTPLPQVRPCAGKDHLKCAHVRTGENRSVAAENIRKLEQAEKNYDELAKQIEGRSND